MWILYGVLFLAAVIAIGPYMARRVGGACELLAPRVSPRVRRVAKWAYYAALYVLPVSVAAIALITRAWVRLPDSRWFDYLLLFPFWLVLLWSLQCAALLLAADAISLTVRATGAVRGRLAPRRRPEATRASTGADTRAARQTARRRAQWRRGHAWLVAVVTSLFAVYIPARVALDRRAIEVHHVRVARPDLPAALGGYRIALIGDLQADRHTGPEALTRYVDTVNAARPDVIVIAGDLITRGSNYIDLAARHAGDLAAPDGVYSVVGDHDNWAFGRDYARSVRTITEALARHGVEMVNDGVVEIEVPGQPSARLALLLFTDNYMNRGRRATLERLAAEADGADLRIVVAHQPSAQLIDHARRLGVDLYLAGHTHGGQIVLWLPFAELSPARIESRYPRGAFTVGTMRVVVSSGLGLSLAPFRYRAAPTIHIIELIRAR